ncbi:unnamed protein product [Lactuca virosa]|uniref:AAA+ ATPase domain-containing protein n=1 Tax=Lactuca virosa TaxID=75947 RepID=A0AAU9M5R8_9ASTR|nr:unnamed protein product [Lactuca virosa]
MDETNENKDTDLQTGENNDLKRQLWRRFRPKLWFSSFWKKHSLDSKLNITKTFLKANIIPASISLAMGICYLLLKSKGQKCKVAPYSDLLKGLQDGSVTRVQFKENSRRIMYNSNPQASQSTKIVKKEHSNNFKEMVASFLTNLSRKPEGLSLTESNSNQSRIDVEVKKRDNNHGWQFSTRYIDDDYRELLHLMKEKGTTYGLDPEPFYVSGGRRVFSTLLNQAPSWAMLSLVAHGLGGGGSIARKPSKNDEVTFDDVEGVDEAKAELLEIVSCLQGDSKYDNLGAKLPRGVLLVGPPGTGKTLLARAVAQKAGVPFFITCAIGLKRGRGFNTEGDQTLNQLLTEMDGFESDKKVVVIAATNRPEMLDSALLRAGRFSRKVFVREPDEDGRKRILGVHFRGVPLEEDKNVIYDLVASLTPGLVGADLANIVNDAALLAARRGGVCVSRDDVMEAVERAKLSFDNRQQHEEFSEQEAREIDLISSRLLGQSRFDY